MSLEKYNPKAREAFANSRIAIGSAVFKSTILLILVAPITVVVKSIIEGKDSLSIFDTFVSVSISTWFTLVFLILGAMVIGSVIEGIGFKHLNKLEDI